MDLTYTHALTNLPYVEVPLDKPPLLFTLLRCCSDPPSILSLGPWSEKSSRVLLFFGGGRGRKIRCEVMPRRKRVAPTFHASDREAIPTCIIYL